MYKQKEFNILILFAFIIVRHSNCAKTHQFSEYCVNPYFFGFSKSNLRLEGGTKSATILQQTWNQTNFKTNRMPSPCEFKINSSMKHNGFIAFVQQMNLRKNLTNNNCIDFLEIKSDKNNYLEICGELGTKINQFKSFKFNETKGKLKIQLKIDYNVSLKDEETLGVILIVTAYSDCRNEKFKFSCDAGNKEVCIDSGLEQDSYYNCPLPHCLDERGCYEIEKTKVINTSNVAISAITSLIFTMVGVGSCIWMCFKHRECLIQCIHAPPRVPPNIEMETAANNSDNRRTVTQSEVKDLPPSYDSLFPE